MKNITLLIVLLLMSCDNSDDSNITTEPNPAIIAEYHVFGSTGEINYKYIFDSNGKIKEIKDELNSSLIKFTFNTSNLLINITKEDASNIIISSTDITYSSENKVNSFGDHTFTYASSEDIMDYIPIENYQLINNDNFYIQDNSYQISPEPTEQQPEQIINFSYLEEDANGYIVFACTNFHLYLYYNDMYESFEEFYDPVWWHYSNDQLSSHGGPFSPTHFSHKTTQNPLYQDDTNLAKINPFMIRYDNETTYLYRQLNHNLLQKNNVAALNYDPEDPISAEIIYEYNDLNLPIQANRLDYYLGSLEYETVSKYYYQGDIIPD